MSTLVEGESVLLGGIAGRYPYDSVAANVVWPATVAKQKSHSQISHSAEDLLLMDEFGGYLAAATEEIESRGEISLISQKRRMLLDRMPCGEAIEITRGPVQSIDAVTYLDADDAEQTLATTLYRGSLKGGSGSIYFKDTSGITTANGPQVVWVDTTCGYGVTPTVVPAQWRELVMVVAARLYERRELAAGGGLDEAFERVIARKVCAAGSLNNRYA